jgi:hypothetical protein
METDMNIIEYRFEGYDEIHRSEEWCWESYAEETRSRLGIPIWIEYKQVNAHTEPHPAATAAISAVRDSIKPTVVSKPTRKTKPKPKAPDVSPMLVVLGDINPVDLVPEILRDRMDGSSNPISDGLAERNDV